jgi:hypothetical protein
MKIKDILNNCPITDKSSLDLIYNYSSTLLSYWQELFYENKGITTGKFLRVKDNLIASMILSNYGYYEQAGALLRVSFENIFNFIVKYTRIRLPEDKSKKMNLTDTSIRMERDMTTTPISYNHNKIYNLYKELCQPIHDPLSSMLTSDMSDTPDYVDYDHNKYKERLKKFVNISSEMLLVTVLYLGIDPAKHLEPQINLFDEEIAQKVSDHYGFNFKIYYNHHCSVTL